MKDLKSKIVIVNGRECNKVLFRGRYRSYSDILAFGDLKELNLTWDVLSHRWRNGDRTEERFLRAKRKKKKNQTIYRPDEEILDCTPEQLKTLGIEHKNIIHSLGEHEEKKPGEILIHYCTENHYHEFVTWQTKRLGWIPNERPHSIYFGKLPLFVQKWEPVELGWVVL